MVYYFSSALVRVKIIANLVADVLINNPNKKSNGMTNKITATVTPAQLDEFKQEIQKLVAKYPWLISLTPAERAGGSHLGEKSYPFVGKVMEYVDSHPQFAPSDLNKVEMKSDFKLWGDINTMVRSTSILWDTLNDSASQAGYEAMEGALAYYNSVREAAKRNAPGAQTIYDELKTRFAGRPTKKPAPTK
jgi:hypothetical protein